MVDSFPFLWTRDDCIRAVVPLPHRDCARIRVRLSGFPSSQTFSKRRSRCPSFWTIWKMSFIWSTSGSFYTAVKYDQIFVECRHFKLFESLNDRVSLRHFWCRSIKSRRWSVRRSKRPRASLWWLGRVLFYRVRITEGCRLHLICSAWTGIYQPLFVCVGRSTFRVASVCCSMNLRGQATIW